MLYEKVLIPCDPGVNNLRVKQQQIARVGGCGLVLW